MAQSMVYQRPSIGHSSHPTTPYATRSRGYHVELPCSTRHALPQGIPQGTPLRNHNTQVYSTMNTHFPYDPLWYHNTEVYHGLLGQYHTPVKHCFIPYLRIAIRGSHRLLSRRSEDCSIILWTWTSCNHVASHPLPPRTEPCISH